MKCQATVKQVKCGKKATLYVRAWGGKGWSGFYCPRHMGRIIRIRSRMIKNYGQSVVVRPITDRDRKQWRKSKRGK
jgi:hypothetical protein